MILEAFLIIGISLVLGVAIASHVSRDIARPLEFANSRCIAVYGAALCTGAYAALRSESTFAVIAVSVVVAIVTLAAITDMQTGFILDVITLPACVILLLLAALSDHLTMSICGALAGAGLPATLYAITKGRGIGLGDVKLGACIGAGLGALTTMYVFGVAFIVGAAAGVALVAAGRATRKTEIRFALYLAIATACVVVCR